MIPTKPEQPRKHLNLDVGPLTQIMEEELFDVLYSVPRDTHGRLGSYTQCVLTIQLIKE
jgi:hypothetical protein